MPSSAQRQEQRPPLWEKTPGEVIDFTFEFAGRTNGTGDEDSLEPGETIASYTVTAAGGLTVEAFSLIRSATAIVFWARGGVVPKSCLVTARIVTTDARIIERSYPIRIVSHKSN